MQRPSSPERGPVAIVGAGLIGRAWAIVFARAGHPVRLHDMDLHTLHSSHAYIEARLGELAEFELIDEAPGTVLARITCVADLAEALRDVVLVQENVRETVEAKIEMFSQLDALAPKDALLASSTSWLPASEFTKDLPGRARCLVAHPTNPPYLIPLVELCPAPWTSADVMLRAHALYSAAGQSPVTLAREIYGFLLNRVQAAVLNECFNLLEQLRVLRRAAVYRVAGVQVDDCRASLGRTNGGFGNLPRCHRQVRGHGRGVNGAGHSAGNDDFTSHGDLLGVLVLLFRIKLRSSVGGVTLVRGQGHQASVAPG